MTAPLVSIIIPCFNAARWIDETIRSALAQTWPRCEIIVIDDGSTDDSLALARAFASCGVRLISQSNAGASAARNHGLRLATGDFIQFLDADDLLAPEKIAAQIELLEGSPRLTLASGRWARFTSSIEGVEFTPYPNYRNLTGVEFLQLFFESCAMMQPGAWLASRELLDLSGPWDESLSLNDDGEYFARVMLRSRGIKHCPNARLYYRSAIATSLGRRCDPRALDSAYRAMESIIRHLLAADSSQRSRAAAAYAWKWLAFELYPGAPELSAHAWQLSRRLGGSPRPFPAGRRFQLLSRFIGWRLAKRLRRH